MTEQLTTIILTQIACILSCGTVTALVSGVAKPWPGHNQYNNL